MRVVSVCTGAGGMDLGFHDAGFKTVAMCEYDPFRRKLLAQNFPGVPVWPDLTTLDPSELPDADVLIGGTPCQDLSGAGKRAGLDGDRSSLYWDYQRIRLANNIPWCVWENVEGAFSSNHGLDFAQVLAAMVGAHVDVPAGGGAHGAGRRTEDDDNYVVPALLKRYAKGTDSDAGDALIVGTLPARGKSGGFDVDPSMAADGHLIQVANCLTRGAEGKPGGRRQEDDFNIVTHTLRASGFDGSEDGTGRGTPLVAATLKATGKSGGRTTDVESTHVIAGTVRSHQRPKSNGADVVLGEPARRAARDTDGRPDEGRREAGAGLSGDQGAERCEAPDADGVRTADGLAGSLDGAQSLVDPKPDGRRYAACGDGVVRQCGAWIGHRLAAAMAVEVRDAA